MGLTTTWFSMVSIMMLSHLTEYIGFLDWKSCKSMKVTTCGCEFSLSFVV